MKLISYFFIAFIISVLGSIPIGLITLAIVQKTIEKGRRAGIILSAGAAIMEFVYALVALIFFDFFIANAYISENTKLIASIIFFLLGLQFLFKNDNPIKTADPNDSYFIFFRGIIVGSLNLLIIPFWLFIIAWLGSYEITLEGSTVFIVFSLGATLGAYVVFLGYVFISEYVVSKSEIFQKYTNKGVAILFISLGVFQLVQFIQ